MAGEYLKKGSQVYVEGHLRTQKWQAQDGQDRYTTEILADELHMLGSRSGGTTSFGGDQPSGGYAAPSSKPASQPAQQNSPGSMPPAPPAYDDFDDDIPF